jgi:hypothetical protein
MKMKERSTEIRSISKTLLMLLLGMALFCSMVFIGCASDDDDTVPAPGEQVGDDDDDVSDDDDDDDDTSDDDDDDDDVPAPDRIAAVTLTDYSTGGLAIIDLSTHTITAQETGNIHSDAVGVAAGEALYILNRLGQDSVSTIDFDNLAVPSRQDSLGNGSNPYSMTFIDDCQAYIALYAETDILLFNVCTGTEVSRIDISSYVDSDGQTEASLAVIADGSLYVALQNLDRAAYFTPTAVGTVLVIDTGDNTISDTIDLNHANPGNLLLDGDGDLIIVSAGGGGFDGGIERLDPVDGTATVIANATALGGTAWGDFAIASDGNVFMVISDPGYTNPDVLIEVDLSDGTVVDDNVMTASAAFTFKGLAISDTDELYLGDRSAAAPGVHVLDLITGDELAAGVISTTLPPSSITFVK